MGFISVLLLKVANLMVIPHQLKNHMKYKVNNMLERQTFC